MLDVAEPCCCRGAEMNGPTLKVASSLTSSMLLLAACTADKARHHSLRYRLLQMPSVAIPLQDVSCCSPFSMADSPVITIQHACPGI